MLFQEYTCAFPYREIFVYLPDISLILINYKLINTQVLLPWAFHPVFADESPCVSPQVFPAFWSGHLLAKLKNKVY